MEGNLPRQFGPKHGSTAIWYSRIHTKLKQKDKEINTENPSSNVYSNFGIKILWNNKRRRLDMPWYSGRLCLSMPLLSLNLNWNQKRNFSIKIHDTIDSIDMENI